MISLEPHAEGVVLPVRAQPGASKSGVRGEHEGQLKVAVTQIAEKGKANQALVQVLAKELNLRRGQIALIAGETAASKRFLIRGVTVAQLSLQIERVLGKSHP